MYKNVSILGRIQELKEAVPRVNYGARRRPWCLAALRATLRLAHDRSTFRKKATFPHPKWPLGSHLRPSLPAFRCSVGAKMLARNSDLLASLTRSAVHTCNRNLSLKLKFSGRNDLKLATRRLFRINTFLWRPWDYRSFSKNRVPELKTSGMRPFVFNQRPGKATRALWIASSWEYSEASTQKASFLIVLDSSDPTRC
jgi:hypothetical protein